MDNGGRERGEEWEGDGFFFLSKAHPQTLGTGNVIAKLL